MKVKQLNTQIYIADQISLGDINTIKKLGIRSVMNNRPDNEEVNQPLSNEISYEFQASGIEYAYLPIAPGIYSQTNIHEFEQLLDTMKKPILIFCRSGNRAVNLWALSKMNTLGKEYVIDKAKNIGFDVSSTINTY
ncbi:TIGR01244 family sulfur transferase [Thalassotalea profundi]|uniref:Oxidoreductase n=1 Tax=Thalassotalea profundi TaxID=2036687 RepID=A0ABQ3IEC8_9GAMM|nr:TIGR01244 family sulfur transferase [Thalassotalea profundi]GHE77772.1 oxidoreductase [Thalassotalea profundi]